jgi:DNA-binding MarR family transcriptional regulator
MDHLDTCLLLARAAAEARRRFDAALGIHGLSLNDFTVLRLLAHAPGGQLRRVDLAERLGVTPSGATRLLAPLEKLGLVVRHANPADARVALAALTDAGRVLVADATTTADELASQLLTDRLADEDIPPLAATLGRLIPATP